MFDKVFPKIVPFFEIMWKNIVERGRPQMTIRRTRIACWISKVTTTHLEYVIPIAYPQQQRLHASASMLRYTLYVHCLPFSLVETVMRNSLPPASG